MKKQEQTAARMFLMSRYEVVLKKLRKQKSYKSCCQKQKNSGAIAEKFLQKLEKGERIVVRRHYEGEFEKIACELEQMYLQGNEDMIKLLLHFGVLHWKEHI